MNIIIPFACLLSILLPWEQAAAGQIQSLRGGVPIDAPSVPADVKHVQREREPIPRDYVQQPPLVPHRIDGYTINLKYNKCLTCHSWRNYRKSGATKISQTHFADRQNNVHANIAARRYFCTQCHVPQADAQPLVENEFRPLPTIRD